jgi:DNA repair protein RadC
MGKRKKDGAMPPEPPQPESPPPAQIGYAGHRARLLEKYIKSGISSLNDYEILELLLTFALPYRDTKPIAKRLLATYGSISSALSAPLDELAAIDGLGRRSAALLALVKETMTFCLNEKFVAKPAISHRGDVEEYLRFSFGHRRDEYMAAVLLDGANRVIAAEVIAEGTVNRCAVYPRQVIEHALKRGAAAFIIAHNHPAGTARPSEEDWKLTERLMTAGNSMDIPLIDHVIITKNSAVSLRDYDRWPV